MLARRFDFDALAVLSLNLLLSVLPAMVLRACACAGGRTGPAFAHCGQALIWRVRGDRELEAALRLSLDHTDSRTFVCPRS